MATGQRQQKYGRQIQKDLSEIFQKDPRRFFGNALVTLTGVEMSSDLSYARVFLSVFPIREVEEVFFSINEKKGEIRRLLGMRIGKQVRIIPELAFIHDDTEEKAARMDRLLDSLNIPPEDQDEDNQ